MSSVLFLMAVLVTGSLAAAGEPQGSGDSSHAKDGPLEAHLIVTNQGEELVTRWSEGAPQLEIRSVDTVRRGEFITVIVLFVGCQADTDGLCNAAVDYLVYSPDGSVYGEMRELELWIGKPPPSPGASQLSVDYMGLIIEPADPAGQYRARATVTDRVSGRSVSLSRTFEVPTPRATADESSARGVGGSALGRRSAAADF